MTKQEKEKGEEMNNSKFEEQKEKLFKKKKLRVRLTGTTPLLMHSQRGMDYHDYRVRELSLLIAKKNKMTDEDKERVADLEWELALYYDKDNGIGAYIPGTAIKAVIREGAKQIREGQEVKKALHIKEDKVVLLYPGRPKTLEGLKNDSSFRDVSFVRIGGNSIMRVRPKFEKWSVEFTVIYDLGKFDNDEIIMFFLKAAGEYNGLLDGRGIGFGRFKAEKVEELVRRRIN